MKPSSWSDTFTKTFGGGGNADKSSLMSEGVDIDSGFVFSLDTMQSYLITKKDRLAEQDSVNTFKIKVHKPGDLPRMQDDKSSWYTIKSNQNDMVTKFISIKGEKVDYKVPVTLIEKMSSDNLLQDSFRDIPQELRKCRFPDEGDLKLFDFYTESNCLLECHWARAEDTCGCRPWHVPSLDQSQTCFVLGNVCFRQIMDKMEDGEMESDCDCSEDCVSSRYTMSVMDRTILERTSINIFENDNFGTKLPVIGTDQVIGNDFTKTQWYNMGKLT